MHNLVRSYHSNYTNIMFVITDRRFYMYYGNILIQGYPKPLTELGLPDDLDHVDAAIVWGHNSKTYIFSGNKYWKLDDKTDRVEFDYPRDISMIWRGVVEHIDAAFQWHDGKQSPFYNKYVQYTFIHSRFCIKRSNA